MLYAGFWLRLVAVLIDAGALFAGLLAIALVVGIVVGIALVGSQGAEEVAEGVGEVVGVLFVFVVPWLYFALFESSLWQGTLGKKALGLMVTDLDGKRISFLRATGRHFGKFISYIALFIGFIMAGFTPKKQALHDMIAGCLVVRR